MLCNVVPCVLCSAPCCGPLTFPLLLLLSLSSSLVVCPALCRLPPVPPSLLTYVSTYSSRRRRRSRVVRPLLLLLFCYSSHYRHRGCRIFFPCSLCVRVILSGPYVYTFERWTLMRELNLRAVLVFSRIWRVFYGSHHWPCDAGHRSVRRPRVQRRQRAGALVDG